LTSAAIPDLHPFFAPVKRRVLPNGLTVLARAVRRQPVVSVHLAVRAGAMMEGSQLGGGLSHYLEHGLFLGSRGRPGPEAFSKAIEGLGGSEQNAHTAHDHTAFYFTVESAGLKAGCRLLADLVFSPLFRRDRLLREKKVIRAEMDMDQDDPDSRMAQDFMERAYPTHPCREPVIGRRALFDALTPEDLEAWHRRRYVPGAMVLALVGDFEVDRALDAAQAAFGRVAGASPEPDAFGDEREPPPSLRETVELPVESPRLRLSWPSCAWSHPDAAVFDLLETLLGWGKHCRFWKGWMARGTFAGMEVSSWTPSFRGLFDVLLTLHHGKAAESAAAVGRFLDELASVHRKFSPGDLEAARFKVFAEAVSALETTPGLASNLAMNELMGGGYGWELEHLGAMAAVGQADLRRVVEQHLKPEAALAVLYAPKGEAGRYAKVLPGSARRSAPELKGRQRAPQRKPESRPIERETLENGAVILRHRGDGAGMAHLALVFAGGQEFEDGSTAGLFHHLIRLMPEGAGGLRSERIQEAFEGRGGFLFPHSGPNHIGLSLSWFPSEEKKILDTLARILEAPAFPARALKVEAARSLESLAMMEESVGDMARQALRTALWGRHGYAPPSCGTPGSIRRLDRRALLEAFPKFVRGGNLVMACAGAVSPERLADLARRLPPGRPSFPAAPVFPPIPPKPLTHRMDKDQTLLHWAFHGPGLAHPDGRWLELLSAWYNGLGGPLFALRGDDALAYQVGFGRHVRRDTSALVFSLTLGKANARKSSTVVSAFARSIERVKRGRIDAAELARAVAVLRGSRGLSAQAWLEECQGLAAHERLGAGWRGHFDETHFPESPAALREGIRGAAERHLDPQRAITLLTGRLA